MKIFLKKKEKGLNDILLNQKKVHKLKKYYDYDDSDYKGIRDIEKLFSEVNEDYYKRIKTEDAFNSNYIEYESS